MKKRNRQIGAAKFKETCLSLLDSVDKEGIVVTKNGKPVAKLVAFQEDRNSFIGRFKSAIKIHGTTESTGIKWNVES